MTMLHEDTAGRLLASLAQPTPISDAVDAERYRRWRAFHLVNNQPVRPDQHDYWVDTKLPPSGLGQRRFWAIDEPAAIETSEADARELTAEQLAELQPGWVALAEPIPHYMSLAATDVLAERQRQVDVEGWTPEHDDQHSTGSMAYAAACYATADMPGCRKWINVIWEWTGWSRIAWWKPKDRRHNLVRAGALILAEIERLDRRQERDHG